MPHNILAFSHQQYALNRFICFISDRLITSGLFCSYRDMILPIKSNVYSPFSNQDTDQVDTFVIEEKTGRVKLAKPLDSVQRNHYSLLVKAEDNSDPPKSDTAEVSETIKRF